MPQFEATLPDGRTVSFEADRQPTNEEFEKYYNENEKTSAAGAFGRRAVRAIGPTTAAMAAFPEGATIGAELGAPLGPIGSGVGALIGGGITSTVAALGAESAQDIAHDVGHVIAPETVDKMDKLAESSLIEHPIASKAADLAVMFPSAEFAPFRTAYGLSKVPRYLFGTADATESYAAKNALAQLGGQAALSVGQNLAQEGKLPTKGDLAEGLVAAALFHEPRFKLLPKSVRAAAASLVEKGKGLYATKEGQVKEGVQPERVGAEAQRVSPEAGAGNRIQPAAGVEEKAQIPLEKRPAQVKRNTRITRDADGSYTIHLEQEGEPTKTAKAKTLMEAQGIASEMEKGQVPKGQQGVPEGPHVEELNEEEARRYEEEEREGMREEAKDREARLAREQHLGAAASELGIPINLTDAEPGTDKVPFAWARTGILARWNRNTGKLDVNRGELNRWLGQIPEQLHPDAMRSLLDEEHIHSKTTDQQALEYWNSLTALEKAIVRKRYTKEWGGRPDLFSDQDMGHEAIRARIQMARGMPVREFLEAVGEGRWGMKSLLALEKWIGRAREALGTRASAVQRGILDHVERRVGLAKQMLESGLAPAAFNRRVKETVEDRVLRELNEAKAHMAAVEERGRTGMAVNAQERQQARDNLQRAWENALDVRAGVPPEPPPTKSPAAYVPLVQPRFWDAFGSDRNTEISGKQIYGTMRNKLGENSMAWMAINTPDFEQFMQDPHSVADVQRWIEQRAPRLDVEIKGGRPHTREDDEIAGMWHEFDTWRYQPVVHQFEPLYVRDTENPHRGLILAQNVLSDSEMRVADRYQQLMENRWNQVAREADTNPAMWQHISPKGSSDSPDYVEGIVRTTTMGNSTKVLYHDPEPEDGGHGFGDNPLGWFRGYMETTDDGKKVFHVIEVQSDWGQKVRDLKKKAKTANELGARVGGPQAALARLRAEKVQIPDHPLLGKWEQIVLKAAIDHAKGRGADAIAVSDAETAMMTEQHDIPWDLQEMMGVTPDQPGEVHQLPNGTWGFEGLDGRIQVHHSRDAAERARAEYLGYGLPQAPGMRLHYDNTLPKTLEKLTGTKPEKADFGEVGRQPSPIFKEEGGKPKTSVTANQFSLKRVRATSEPGFFGNQLGPAAFNKLGEPYGTQYPASEADWTEWQKLMARPMLKDGQIDSELWQARETMKNKYGGMPPLPPGSEKKLGGQGPAAFNPESDEVREELRRREEAKQRRIRRERERSQDVPIGALGQNIFDMPHLSAQKVVEPMTAVEAGATPPITAAQLTGAHGLVDAQGQPVPDKPGFIDEYLNREISFSAAPRTRQAEVQGEEEEYTEYRRRSDRPNYRDFSREARERFGSHLPEEFLQNTWIDGVWRHIENADSERLVQLAKSSRSKRLARYQYLSMEEGMKTLEPGEPEVPEGFQEETEGRPRIEGGGLPEVGKEGERQKTRMAAQAPTSTFSLEGEIIGKQHKLDVERSIEWKRLHRERMKAAGERVVRANKNRQNIADQVGAEMTNEAKPREQPVLRTEVTLDDIDFSKEESDVRGKGQQPTKGTVEGVVRDISREEAANPDILKRIITDSARVKETDPVSYTKRVVAILDQQTGRLHLVSAYEIGGRGEAEVAKVAKEGEPVAESSITKKTGKSKAMVVDPEKFGLKDRPNVDIQELLARKYGTTRGPAQRYQPIQTLLLRNPVQNFMQVWDTAAEYLNQLGKPAAEQWRAEKYSRFVGEAQMMARRGEMEGRPGEEIHREGFPGEVSGISSEEPPPRPGVPRGTGVQFGEGGGMQGPHAELGRGPQGLGKSLIQRSQRKPLVASEALALRKLMLAVSAREPLTEELFMQTLARAATGALAGPERNTMAAIVKATEKAWEDAQNDYLQKIREWRGLGRERRKETPEPIKPTVEQTYAKTIKAFYEATTSAKTAGDYLASVMGQFGKPDIEELSPTRQQAELREVAARERASRQAIGTSRDVTIGTVGGRDVFGRPVVPRRAGIPTRTPLPRTEVGATGEAYLPPEMLPARPEAIAARPEGSPYVVPTPGRVDVPEGVNARRRGLGMVTGEAFGAGQRQPPTSLNIAKLPEAERTTIRRMVPSPGGEPRVSAPPGGLHPLSGEAGFEGRAVVVPEPSQRLSPEERALREAGVERQKQLLAEKAERKGKYLPGMGPAAFNAAQQTVKDELERITTAMRAKFITRRSAKESVYTELDAQSNIGNIDASNRGNVTRTASLGGLTEQALESGRYSAIRRRERKVTAEKARIVRKAAVAVISTGDIVSGGGYYTDSRGNRRQRMFWASNKDRLTAPLVTFQGGVPDHRNSGMIAMAEEAMKQAQISMSKRDLWSRMMGRRWYKAAVELRDAAVWARDHWLDPELKKTVAEARLQLRDQWQKEADKGLRMRRDWNYVPGRYDAELWNDDKVFFGQPRILGRNFRQPSTFDNYYHAILSGPYIAKNLDIADLVEHRSRQGNEMLAKGKWYNYLMGLEDPETGKAVAVELERGEAQPIMEKGQVLRDKETGKALKDPQGNLIRGPEEKARDERGTIMTTPGKLRLPDGYEMVALDRGRKLIGVLSAFKTAVENAAGESPIRKHPISAEFLHFGQWLKHNGILIYDTFHPTRLFQYAVALGGGEPWKLEKVGAARGYAALEYKPEDLDRAVETGEVMKSDADWARETVGIRLGDRTVEATRHEILRLALEEGANLGRLQDALFATSKNIIPGVETMNKWVFKRITRGLMSEAIVRNFENLNAKYPNMPARTLMRQVAKDMNFFFGSIGRQGVIKSPMLRDMAQMMFLAPQWVEGLAQKEARFYSRLVSAPVKMALGHEGPKLGALGGAMAKGLLIWFGMTQVFNLIFRQKFTFQNEEEDHKWDAWIPAGKHGFWVSPMSVFAELSHDAIRMFETKPTAYDALETIGRNKLGPWGRMGIVLTSKQNAQGEFIPTTAGRIGEAIQQVVPPIPITGSWILKTLGSEAAARGIPVPSAIRRPPQPGSFPRQVAASVLGVKGQPADSPLQRMTRLANQFVQSHHLRADTMEFLPTTEPSYSKLRSVLRAGDTAGAVRMLGDLHKQHTDSQVYHAMSVWARSPLTGSHTNEQRFVASLTPEQRQVYSHAMEERLNILQSYIQAYKAYKSYPGR